MGTLIGLDLRQRTRGAGWLVVHVLWVLAIAGLTVASVFSDTRSSAATGAWLFSAILLFTLFLSTIVVPAVAGGSISADRESGLLAQVQVTTTSAGAIVWAKAVATWLASLLFVLTAAPFLAYAAWAGGVDWQVIVAAAIGLLAELAFFSAVSVALSGIVRSPVLSITVAYLVIALLSVGTVIAYGTVSTVVASTRAVQVLKPVPGAADGSSTTPGDSSNPTPDGSGATGSGETGSGTAGSGEAVQPRCETVTEQRTYPRTDLVWPLLAANPFVIVADATPARFTTAANGGTPGYPDNLLTEIKVTVREAQHSPIPTQTIDECTWETPVITPQEQLQNTQPVWFAGLGGQAVLALILLFWATARTRAPYGSLPRGQRLE